MTSGTYTNNWNTDLKAQIDWRDRGLSFGYFAILLTSTVFERNARFGENDLIKLEKFTFSTPWDLNFD